MEKFFYFLFISYWLLLCCVSGKGYRDDFLFLFWENSGCSIMVQVKERSSIVTVVDLRSGSKGFGRIG